MITGEGIRRIERIHAGRKEVEYTIDIDWRGNPKRSNNYRWYLWEVHHQQDRPSNMVLVLKDNDPDNVVYENLEMITRSELASRNRKKGKF